MNIPPHPPPRVGLTCSKSKESVSSGFNGVAVERSGLGPRAWYLLGLGGHLLTVPPRGWGDHRAFWGAGLGGGEGQGLAG